MRDRIREGIENRGYWFRRLHDEYADEPLPIGKAVRVLQGKIFVVENGRLIVFDDGAQCDVTGWSLRRLMEWLGY